MIDKRVRMVQISPYRWQLISPKGHVLVDDILANNKRDAEAWAKSYISSFHGWEIQLEPKEET